MKTYNSKFLLLFFTGVLFTTGMAYGWDKVTATTKGAKKPMKTYYLGRFSLAVPAEMHEAQGSRMHKLRHVELVEKAWPNGVSHEKARLVEWNKFLSEIKDIPLPQGERNIILKSQDFPGIWSKGVFFHNKNDSKIEGTWKVLMDNGHTEVWLKGLSVVVEKENKSKLMENNITNICRSYQYITQSIHQSKNDWFYLKYGAINLPYKWQEKSYIRFEGHPLDLKLEVEMDMDANYKRPQHGLMDKVSTALVSGFASAANVSVKKIRSHKREVAGMPGEEVINRLTENSDKTLSFAWEYVGKDDSGEYPTTRITMESPDGNLDEKLKIWDAVLDSMKPMFERKN